MIPGFYINHYEVLYRVALIWNKAFENWSFRGKKLTLSVWF